MHAPDARQVEKKRTLAGIKNAAKNSRDSAKRIIADAAGNVTMATSAVLPSVKSMTRMIGRIRNTENYPKNPKNLSELALADRFVTTAKGENFLLFDSGPNVKRTLMFGTTSNLQFLAECNCLFMDGTFDVTPPLFAQLYTIHGNIKILFA